MKIATKLTGSFFTIALLVLITGLFSTYRSRTILEKTIGENSIALAGEILDKIDRGVYNKIEEFQVYAKSLLLQEAVRKSNQEFEVLDNLQAYIDEKDKEWVSMPKETITPFMRRLIDSRVSRELIEKLELYEKKYGHKVYGEVFVTNKYGVNVAQTGKTSDYYQADENWWQKAKKDGLFVRNVDYDESADVYSIDIGIRIDDEAGNFLGVIKVVSNVDEVFAIIKRPGYLSEYKTTEFKLLTKDGKTIYSSGGFKFFDITSSYLISHVEKEEVAGFYFIGSEDEPGGSEKLFAHAHSKGYRDFKGLNWILVAEHETREIFAPVAKLERALIGISIFTVILSLFVGFLVSRSISSPLTKLRDLASEIGKGSFVVKTDIQSRDEIGTLASSLVDMSKHLQDRTTSIDNLNREIAERKKTEKMLQKAYVKLQEAQDMVIRAEKLNAIGQLASGVAHEVRNPLGIIMQSINYLEEKIPIGEQDASEALAMAKDSVKRADKIINGLLDFSKVTVLNLQPEDINSIIESSLALVSVKFTNIEVVRETKKNLPKILVEKNRLEQVFVNILLNAAQAMPEGGKITVRSYAKQFREVKDRVGNRKEDHFKAGEKAVMVEVEDNGSGIAEEKLKRVFDPFFTTKGPGGGSGLGLSVSRNIITMHKGLMELESQAGKGTRVVLALKVARR